jgi:hypothetical protein
MIGQPVIAFMASLHGASMVAILSLIVIIGLVIYSMDNHRVALFWLIGFMIVVGVIVAIATEGQAWFAGA